MLRFLKLSPRSLDRFLTKYGWGPNLKGNFGQRWMHIEGRHCEEVEEDTATYKPRTEVWNWFFLHRLQKKPTKPTTWFQTWSLWKCETVNFYCLNQRRKFIRQSRTFQYSLLWQSISRSVVSNSATPRTAGILCRGSEPPGSCVHGTLQARILRWAAMSFSKGSSRPKDRTSVSRIGRQTLYHLSHQGIQGNELRGPAQPQPIYCPLDWWTLKAPGMAMLQNREGRSGKS